MQIDIQFLPFRPDSSLISNRVVVVIDILRATSVMVRAMSQGAKEIIPVKTVEEAFQVSKNFARNSILLGGEKDTRRIAGFDLGNSPREYIAERISGKRVIMTTTNGTRAFHSVSSGKEILVASFLNIGAIVERCLEQNRDLFIFPSGDEGNFSLEDTVCGGMLIDRIIKQGKKTPVLTDASVSAHILYRRFEVNLLEAFHLSHHGKKLISLGHEEDLVFCSQIDITHIIPVFREGVIK